MPYAPHRRTKFCWSNAMISRNFSHHSITFDILWSHKRACVCVCACVCFVLFLLLSVCIFLPPMSPLSNPLFILIMLPFFLWSLPARSFCWCLGIRMHRGGGGGDYCPEEDLIGIHARLAVTSPSYSFIISINIPSCRLRDKRYAVDQSILSRTTVDSNKLRVMSWHGLDLSLNISKYQTVCCV